MSVEYDTLRLLFSCTLATSACTLQTACALTRIVISLLICSAAQYYARSNMMCASICNAGYLNEQLVTVDAPSLDLLVL
jgi:hypothetical protein